MSPPVSRQGTFTKLQPSPGDSDTPPPRPPRLSKDQIKDASPPPPPPPPSKALMTLEPERPKTVTRVRPSTRKPHQENVDESYVLNLKRPPKIVIVKKQKEYPFHKYNNVGPTGVCEEGFTPNMFIKDKCRNCG